jgi:hypothetical protein
MSRLRMSEIWMATVVLRTGLAVVPKSGSLHGNDQRTLFEIEHLRS